MKPGRYSWDGMSSTAGSGPEHQWKRSRNCNSRKKWIYSRIWWTNPVIQDWGLICPFRLSEATLRERETSWRHLPWLSPVLEWVGGWLMVAGGGRWSFLVASCLCTASVNPLDLKPRKCRSLQNYCWCCSALTCHLSSLDTWFTLT